MSSLYKRGNTYWYTAWINGKKHFESTGKSNIRAAEAKKIELDAKYFRDGINPATGRIIAHDCLDRFLDSLKTVVSEEHHYNSRLLLKQFLEWSAVIYMNQITPQIIEQYINYRRNRGVLNKTGNKIRDISKWALWHDYSRIRAWLNWCEQNSIISDNPIKKVRSPKTEKIIPPFLSKEKARMLIDSTDGDLKYMVVITLYTGLRAGELKRLRWEDFDWDRNILVVQKSKNQKFRTIPFNPLLRDYLKPIIKNRGLIFDYYDIPLTKQWAKIQSMDVFKGIRWHHLRHTYASHLVLDGVPLRVVSELLGHADIKTTMIYSHLLEKHKEDLVKSFSY